MLIIAVEFAGLKIPFVMAPTTINVAGRSQWESARSSPPLARDTIINKTPRVAGIRGPKRSVRYPLKGASATVNTDGAINRSPTRSEEHTSELQSRFGISYAVFCL